MPTKTSLGEEIARNAQSVSTEKDARQLITAIQKRLGTTDWRAVGDRPNNAGTIQIASDPNAAMVERITNAIDAALEYMAATQKGPLPDSPRQAARRWFGVPTAGIGELTDKERRALAERVAAVTLHESGDASRPTTRVRDHGVGEHPDSAHGTLLSLNEGNKVGKAYLQGAYGQGASATYRFARYTVIITRLAPELLNGRDDLVGVTVVWEDPGDPTVDKLPTYKYLVDAEGNLPMFEPSWLEDPCWHGVDVIHVAYDLQGYTGAYNQPKNGIWALFHSALFDPVLPFLVGGDRKIDDSAAGAGTTRVIIGNAARLDSPTGPRGDLELAHRDTVTVDLSKKLGGDVGEVAVRIWALRRPATSTSTSDPSASYVTPDSAVTMTLSGQRQDTESRTFIRHRGGLPVLARGLVVQVDVDRLTPSARRTLFSSTRERAVKGPLRDAIYEAVAEVLQTDDELRRLEREERDRLLDRAAEEVDEKVRQKLSKHIQTRLRDKTRLVRRPYPGPSTPTGGGGTSRRDTDDSKMLAEPTVMKFEKDHITVKRGASTTVWVHINAKNGYLPTHQNNLTTTFSAKAAGKIADVSKSELQGGRSLWRIQADVDAPLGEHSMEAVLVTGNGVLHASCKVTVVAAPKTKRTRLEKEPETGPEVKWVTREGWAKMGWDERTVGEVQVSADSTVIFVNRHQRLVERAIDRNKRLSKEAMAGRANRYLLPVALALYEQYRAVTSGGQKEPEKDYFVGEMERLAEAVLLAVDQDALDGDTE